eukprot:scaffold34154_cov32-Prasinocladus_malaysianus.AAC.2
MARATALFSTTSVHQSINSHQWLFVSRRKQPIMSQFFSYSSHVRYLQSATRYVSDKLQRHEGPQVLRHQFGRQAGDGRHRRERPAAPPRLLTGQPALPGRRPASPGPGGPDCAHGPQHGRRPGGGAGAGPAGEGLPRQQDCHLGGAKGRPRRHRGLLQAPGHPQGQPRGRPRGVPSSHKTNGVGRHATMIHNALFKPKSPHHLLLRPVHRYK